MGTYWYLRYLCTNKHLVDALYKLSKNQSFKWFSETEFQVFISSTSYYKYGRFERNSSPFACQILNIQCNKVSHE